MKPIKFQAMDCCNVGIIVDGRHIASIHFWLPNRPEWAEMPHVYQNIDSVTICLNELIDESDDYNPLIRFIHDENKDFVRIECDLPLDPYTEGIFGNTNDYTGLVVNSFKSVWDRKNNPRQNANDALWFMEQLKD